MALDAKQIVKKVYNPTYDSLRAKDVGPATSPQPTVHLSSGQIWKRIFYSLTDRIQVVKV